MKRHYSVPFPVLLLAALVTGAEPSRTIDWSAHPANQWVRQSPRDGKPAPAFGWEGSGAYDPWTRKWIHFGGHDGIPQGFPLFTFDPATGGWEQKFPSTSPPGVCCVDGANTFDVARRRFVRFPGASLGHGFQWSRGVKLKNSHVWLYDPAANSWMNMRPEPYRPFLAREGLGTLDAAGTYDPVHELSLSFGGQGNSGGMNNLFAYDAYANRLYRLDAENLPSRRDGMGLAYDAKNNCLVMFGSQYDNDERTWIYRYDTNRWEGLELDPHPPGKKLGTYSTIPKMAYDSLHEVCVCVTWDTNNGKHETWAFDAGKKDWTKMNPPVEPDPSMSRSRNLDFDAERNVFILETSSQKSKGKGPEIWTYRYAFTPAEARPKPPGDVQVATHAGKAVVTWSPVAGASGYHVYRALPEKPWEADWKLVAKVQTSPVEDAPLEAGKAYVYTVLSLDTDGNASRRSFRARTQPSVLPQPVVSVHATNKVEVRWQKHAAADVRGYNIYRGDVAVRTVRKGVQAPWKDNDPEYAEPVPAEVRDITDIRKLNDQPLTATTYLDGHADLFRKDAEPDGYRYNLYAYIVRAVNELGTESGPSPYALTIPSEPTSVFCREQGTDAELKWEPNSEQGIAGYHVYKLGKGRMEILRVTDKPIAETTFRHAAGRETTRYWVTAVDALGQEGQPSSPVWYRQSYQGFFAGEWHQ